MINRKGQMGLILAVAVVLATIMWILISPLLTTILNDTIAANNFGGAVNFLIRLITWIGLIFLVWNIINKINGVGTQ